MRGTMGEYYFPMFVDISEKRVLVIGGGRIAARRVRTLLRFTGHIVVAAPEIGEEMRALFEERGLAEEQSQMCPKAAAEERLGLIWERRRISARELAEGALPGKPDIVLTATDDRELNRAVVEECRKRKIPVNTADDKTLCDFYFPAVAEKDGVVIGLNSGGKSPAAVRKLREYLEEL